MTRSFQPAVSVLLATYNGAKYLRQSLDSMASQSFEDWEWVLVDDGSTDETPALMDYYAKTWGEKVRIMRNESNIGLTASLNRGLREARGEFIARMDDDDVAHPDRLALQVAAMRADARLLLVGSAAYRYHEATGLVDAYLPHYDAVRLRIEMCWHNPILHSSIMMRRSFLEAGGVLYPDAYPAAEDYAMWARLAMAGCMAVLEDKLITYRCRSESVSGKKRALQLESTQRVSEWYTSEFTRNTPLEGCRPDDIRRWMTDPLIPDVQRLTKVSQVFHAASSLPQITVEERRRAFMRWAEPYLERQRWRDLFSPRLAGLWHECGWKAAGYALRRVAKP